MENVVPPLKEKAQENSAGSPEPKNADDTEVA
jgi:hypothetical protein